MDSLIDMTTKQQQAFDDGYKAGYNDDGTKCPYPEDSELDNYSRSFDELEDELNKAYYHIKRLKQAGDVMYTLLDPPSISMRTTEYDNALQGWDDAKIKY